MTATTNQTAGTVDNVTSLHVDRLDILEATINREAAMQTKRQGRPELPASAKRKHKVGIRLDDAELELLRAEADQRHVALSVWLRLRIFSNGTTATA